MPSLSPSGVADGQGAGGRVEVARLHRPAEQRAGRRRDDPDDVHEAVGHEERARRARRPGRGDRSARPSDRWRAARPRDTARSLPMPPTTTPMSPAPTARPAERPAGRTGASSTDWSPLSATRRSPATSTATATGFHSWAARERTALPGTAADARARHGEEVPGRHGLPEERCRSTAGQHAHPAVGRVGDEEVTGRVHRHARWAGRARSAWRRARRR